VVHRLDRETSGIILFAKSEDAHRKLSMDFEHRRVDKYYYCLVDGRWGKDQTVDMGIESHASKKRMKVSPKGKSAISHFKLLEKFDKWSLLEVQIETGRTHQIRVHAQHLGYPIVADPLYNTGTPLTIHQIKKNSNKSKGEVVPLISRTALHAERVSLIHPITDETLSLAAPLPKDFRAALNQLRKWATIQ
jgi:23S rRNA pseudouridine955/2504/2580 synthase/23S rRNA pseudouridine1911/1915/1917 synthase